MNHFEALEARRVLAALVGPDQPLDVSVSGDGTFVVATADSASDPLTFEQFDTGDGNDQWIARNLADLPDAGALVDGLESWTDPASSRAIAGGAVPGGLSDFIRSDNGTTWEQRDFPLDTEQRIVGQFTSFTDSNRAYVAGFNADGDLLLYASAGDSWAVDNLTDSEFAGQPLGFAGPVTGFTTSWGSLNIVGLNGDGEIQSVWISPGMNDWTLSNLSEIAEAPALAGELDVFTTPWGGVNVAGFTPEGQLVVVWWTPELEGNWVSSNFTEQFDGPDLMPGSITAYVTPWNGLNIAGIDGANGVWVYWWAPEFAADPANNFWRATMISEEAGISQPIAPDSLVSGVRDDGRIGIFGTEEDGELIWITWKPGDSNWQGENLSQRALEGPDGDEPEVDIDGFFSDAGIPIQGFDVNDLVDDIIGIF